MEEENNGFAKSSLALSFTAGGIVGAALAILYAPSEGRQTREKIKELAEEAKEKTNQFQKRGKKRPPASWKKEKRLKNRERKPFPMVLTTRRTNPQPTRKTPPHREKPNRRERNFS